MIHSEMIDLHNIGTCSFRIKLTIVIVLCSVIWIVGYWVFIDSKKDYLTKLEKEELTLKATYAEQQSLLIDVQNYQDQIEKIQTTLLSLVHKLPAENEFSNLIDQMSHAASQSGLKINQIKILPEKTFKYYVELPIHIQVEGDYHQLGKYISNVSNMNRVITFHNFNIERTLNNSTAEISILKMDLMAKTYRYLTVDKVKNANVRSL